MITMKIRQSHARTYKQCERKYDFVVNHKLTPKNKKISLSIGTACHAGRAEWLKTWDTAKCLMATAASLDAEVINYPQLGQRAHDNKICNNNPCLDCARRISQETMAYYCNTFYDANRFPKGSITVLATETPFEYTLAQYEELEMILTGTFDAAVMWGPYFLNFEFKTTKKQLPQFFEEEVTSPQHRAYPMALQAMFPERHVYGTVIDAIRKPGKTYEPEAKHELIQTDERDIDELRRDYVEQLKRIAQSMTDDYWSANWDNCHTIRGRCEYYPICKSKFNPMVIQSQYVVVDDLKTLVEDDEDPTAA